MGQIRNPSTGAQMDVEWLSPSVHMELMWMEFSPTTKRDLQLWKISKPQNHCLALVQLPIHHRCQQWTVSGLLNY